MCLCMLLCVCVRAGVRAFMGVFLMFLVCVYDGGRDG